MDKLDALIAQGPNRRYRVAAVVLGRQDAIAEARRLLWDWRTITAALGLPPEDWRAVARAYGKAQQRGSQTKVGASGHVEASPVGKNIKIDL